MKIMISYVLNDEGISFYIDGILAFDCPLDRMRENPNDALKAMLILEKIWERKLNT